MTEAERSKYDGRDMVILNRHTEDTIQEDKLSFPMQMENHFAHVRMLWEQGILTHKEARAISAALRKLLAAGPDATGRRPGLTDLFSNLEEWLIEELGIEVGGKFHTGRSRNDMNLTIERMNTRKTLLDMCEAVSFLMDTLLRKAEEHKNTIIPGYTHHSQHAQPVTLGHFYLSAFENFARDLERLLAAYDHTNLSPMGGAAIATTGFPINRERVAELLGFDGLLLNSMNATSSLDFAYEAASAMCIFIQNVGRMAESLLLWNMGEVGISRLNLKYCSYSTIMPQKRNPVALETLRYSGEWSYGALSTMFNTMKAYTPGNGREPGFVVSLYYEIAQRVMDSAYLLEGIVRTLEVDRERALDMTRKGFSTMTELADELVRSQGLSFAAAKKLVGRLVLLAHEEHIPCEAIGRDLLHRAGLEALGVEVDMPEELLRAALDPVQNVERRSLIGGPSPARVAEMIQWGGGRLKELDSQWKARGDRLKRASSRLEELTDALIREEES